MGGVVILIGDQIAPNVVGMGYLFLYALGASLQILSGFMIFCVRISRSQDCGSQVTPAVTPAPAKDSQETTEAVQPSEEHPINGEKIAEDLELEEIDLENKK